MAAYKFGNLCSDKPSLFSLPKKSIIQKRANETNLQYWSL